MSFIRAKEIPPHSGNWYDYEVKTVHEGGKVIQKHIRYIGKSGMSGGVAIGGSRRMLKDTRILAGNTTPEPKVACKTCGGQETRKYGTYKGTQYYYCNKCRRKFIGTDALPGGRVSPSFIANALHEYYNGMSLHDIEDNIEKQTDSGISHVAILKWINKYTEQAINETKDLRPNVGDVWIADETFLQTDQKEKDPKGVKFWDIIDAKTRFILATQVTTTRSTADAKRLMEMAAKRAGKTPRVVVTDGLPAYIGGIEQAFGSDTLHKRGSPFKFRETGLNTALIERFHNTFKDRTKVMRDLRNRKTVDRFGEGWLVHYNFYRPHTALNGKTPAEQAGLKYEHHDWASLIGYEKKPIVEKLEPTPVQESA